MAIKIYLIAELVERRITPESYEALACARLMTEDSPEIILLGREPEAPARQMAEATGLRVKAIAADNLEPYHPEHHRDAILEIVERQETFRLVLPHSAMGWDLAPRLAVRLGAACITAVEGLSGECFVRSFLGGKIRGLLRPPTQRLVLTVQPGAFSPDARSSAPPGPVECRRVRLAASRIQALGFCAAEPADESLPEAPVIVAVGRGMGKRENIVLARRLAALFPRAAIGASRGACDAGWLPHRLQIGATGQRVAPGLYLACGISGASQHLAGMRHSRLIVAINRDPRAAIFEAAHIGIVEDLMIFIPVLLEEHGKQKG